ncbi:Kidney mitochondrial carrier protein 1-like [Homarus americanus]|uniref:Kidney mitochondrial carrier protein 1-like n=1 Tax=Homarus americanus TaxID=6706 RepID=A0A8J5N094_HOMAM|nr:Kidney mitochondrial carrier protein 1-like [Homarus americanus]
MTGGGEGVIEDASSRVRLIDSSSYCVDRTSHDVRIAPAVLRQATYGTIKFGIYYSLKQMLVNNPNEERLGINVFCAVTAGVVASSMANPTDVLKVRLQSGRAEFKEKSLPQAFLSIYNQEGIQGLWRMFRKRMSGMNQGSFGTWQRIPKPRSQTTYPARVPSPGGTVGPLAEEPP